MRFGIREMLLAAAVLLFVVAVISDDNPFDFLGLGLAAFAGAFLADELDVARGRLGPRRRG
ncbi:MAG: hypothetical protein M3Q48_15495 [Actinomycetota bacterium]|nr:hypothetical protein [Actinomycetota bacterium]